MGASGKTLEQGRPSFQFLELTARKGIWGAGALKKEKKLETLSQMHGKGGDLRLLPK